MSRSIRLEYPGAVWHVSSYGNAGTTIFRDDRDRDVFLEFVARAVDRSAWIVSAYVLMPREYQLVIELTRPTLSSGAQWLNSHYAQRFNWRHKRVGHLFHSPFVGRLVEKETYGARLLREVVLTPVKERVVDRADEFAWSSHRAILGVAAAPSWLHTSEALSHFGNVTTIARERYRDFVETDVNAMPSVWNDLVGGLYLGSRAWLTDVQARLDSKPRSSDHPWFQREIARPSMRLIARVVAIAFGRTESEICRAGGSTARALAAWIGRYESHLSDTKIARELHVRSVSQVSKIVEGCERQFKSDAWLRDVADRCRAALRSTNEQLQL